MDSSLFRNRIPEASAHQLAIVLKSAVEMHLATLERLRGRKSTPKSDIERQVKICGDLVAQCVDLDVPVDMRGLRGFPCPRLDELLTKARAQAAAESQTVRDWEGATHTTDSGESLCGIALRQLGDETRWTEIRDLNADRFPDMLGADYYPVGTVLKMPARLQEKGETGQSHPSPEGRRSA